MSQHVTVTYLLINQNNRNKLTSDIVTEDITCSNTEVVSAVCHARHPTVYVPHAAEVLGARRRDVQIW